MSKKEERAEASASFVRNHRGVMRFFWRAHRLLYSISGGRLGRKMGGNPVLMLTTVGRKSGEPRTVGLYYFPDGKNMVVIASNGGQDYAPAWWLNLQANPEAEVQIGSRKLTVRAEEAQGEEYGRLWSMVKRLDPTFTGYEKLSKRQFPVVILRPSRPA
jgi:deazaflavin-dependent oxidoreductase (nitroreductase family)